MYIGHLDSVEDSGRWWIPVTLEDNVRSLSTTQLSIDFEMSIPTRHNLRLSTHYIKDEEDNLYIVQKGKFTVRHGSISMREFFRYYMAQPDCLQYLRRGRIVVKLSSLFIYPLCVFF